MCPRSWRAPSDLNGVFRVVPRINLTGFQHETFERPIVLRNGLLQEGATSWEDERSLMDPRPDPTAEMIQEAIVADQRRLQGNWKVVDGGTGDGQSGDGGEDVLWTIADDKIVFKVGKRIEGKFTLDPAKSPRRIDIVATSSDGEKPEELRGVYELSGDDLCICLGSGVDPRPADLRASSGSGQVLFRLKRADP